jgi:hypothetical protein
MLSDLVAFLEGLSTAAGTRIYPQTLPQAPVYPAITYNQVSGVRDRDLCGPTGRARPRITINSWAEVYGDVHTMADAIRSALNGYRGSMGGTVIGNVILDNEFDLFEEGAGTRGVHRVVQDYIISFAED